MQIFENMQNKENFSEWLFISAWIVLITYGLTIVSIRIYYAKFDKKWNELTPERAANMWVFQPEIVIQRIFEVIISDTCILGACFVYLFLTEKISFFEDYNGFILLGLIVIAILLNNFIDNKLHLTYLNKKIGDELGKNEIDYEVLANIRLLSSFSVLILLIGFSFYFETDMYMQLILCMVGLVLGRFIYFDSTIEGFVKTLYQLKNTICYTFFGLVLTVLILGIGIHLNVIESNNFLTGILGGHIFTILVISSTKKVIEDLF